MGVEELKPHLQTHWERIKEPLQEGSYQPQPVRRVEIPKPGAKGMRKLGVPTVVDRLIQHHSHQVFSDLPFIKKRFKKSPASRNTISRRVRTALR